MIISKENQVKKYEQLRRSLTDAENPTFRSFALSDDFSAHRNTSGGSSRKALPHLGGKGDDQRSLADFDQGEETSSGYMHHLVSLFDRLIIEVDTPAYRIGLLSRYRNRTYIYKARSRELNHLYSLHGPAALEATRKVLDLSVHQARSARHSRRGDERLTFSFYIPRGSRRMPGDSPGRHAETSQFIPERSGIKSPDSDMVCGCHVLSDSSWKSLVHDINVSNNELLSYSSTLMETH